MPYEKRFILSRSEGQSKIKPARRDRKLASQSDTMACCIKHVGVENAQNRSSKSQRELWLGKLDFFMSVMGFNIGLGNLLRFPYLCMRNGGGAFLIPYFLFLFIIGIPMFLMEMSLAQYSGMTPLEYYGNISPIFKGIGWCNVIACGIYNLYYNMLMAWIIFYIGKSVLSPLPWTLCDNTWNTNKCRINSINEGNNQTQQSSCQSRKIYNTPAEEYWEFKVLNLSPGIHKLGSVNWPITLCLCLAWVFVYLCLVKGIKSMGRIVYITALSPYILLLILLIRGCLLSGSREGIVYYLYPRMKYLANPKAWMEAGQQIFWSLAPGWGITISLASHNRFSHNIYRDSIMLPIVSCFTSFLGGFVIFAFIGHISYRYSLHIDCLFRVGPGLAFNVYPEALQLLPVPQIWCLFFFLLLFVLGLDSSFTSFETVYDSLKQEYWQFFQKFDISLKIGFIVLSFLISLPFVTQGGYYLFQLIDYYQIALFPLIILIEVLVVSFLYKISRLKENIFVMTGYKLTIMWDIIYKTALPITLTILLIFTLYTQTDLTYGSYEYPKTAIFLGWILAIIGFLPLPIYGIYLVLSIRAKSTELKTIIEIIKESCQATSVWTAEERQAKQEILLESINITNDDKA